MNRVASQFRDIAREGAVRFAFCRFFFGPSFEFRAEAAGCRHGRPERRPLVAFRPALDSSRSSLRSGCLVEPAAAPAFSIAQQSTTWPSWAEFFVSFRWLPVDRTVSSLWRTIDVRTPCGCSSSEPSESSSSWFFFLHYSRVCRVSQRMVTVMPYLDSGSAIPQSGSHVDLRDDSHRQVFWYWLSSGRNLKKNIPFTLVRWTGYLSFPISPFLNGYRHLVSTIKEPCSISNYPWNIWFCFGIFFKMAFNL